MKHLKIKSDKFGGYIQVDDNGIIVNTIPLLKRFVGQSLDNLINWVMFKFKYCTLQELKNDK